MKVQSIGAINAQPLKKVSFAHDDYENPISRSTEKKLAILATAGGSAVVGAIVGGLVSCVTKGKGYKIPLLSGIGAAILTLALALPSKLYNTAVNAFAKEKEMDVFSRDKDLKSSLTAEVHKEVKDPEVSLDKKLDDNLKLQMGNRATAMLIQH